MNTLYEMITNAQDGKAFDNLARQFQLSQEQAQSAVNALLPAFQMALQRQAESADMMGNFLRTLSGVEKPAPEPEKNDVLSMLFGNRDVANAVSAQAAQFAGIPNTIMNNMMPVLATMIMSGLMKNMSSQGYGAWLTQMTQAMFAGMQNSAIPSPQDAMAQMMGMGAPKNSGVFGDIGAMMDSWMGTAKPREPENPMEQGLKALTGMFEAGAKVQQTHWDGMASIFNSMLKQNQS